MPGNSAVAGVADRARDETGDPPDSAPHSSDMAEGSEYGLGPDVEPGRIDQNERLDLGRSVRECKRGVRGALQGGKAEDTPAVVPEAPTHGAVAEPTIAIIEQDRMVHIPSARLERATPSLGNRCSIHLSYEGEFPHSINEMPAER